MMPNFLAPTETFPITCRPVSSYCLDISPVCSPGTSDLIDSKLLTRVLAFAQPVPVLVGNTSIQELPTHSPLVSKSYSVAGFLSRFSPLTIPDASAVFQALLHSPG